MGQKPKIYLTCISKLSVDDGTVHFNFVFSSFFFLFIGSWKATFLFFVVFFFLCVILKLTLSALIIDITAGDNRIFVWVQYAAFYLLS